MTPSSSRSVKRALYRTCQSSTISNWAGSRGFCSSRPRCDHYAALGVPRNATKSQIKSNFYKLSKKHHPDLSNDPGSPAIFSAIREAYDVLGDDRARRQYDRDRAPSHTAGPTGSRAAGPSYSRTTETHRGATHAWQHSTYRSGASRTHPHSASGGKPRHPGSTNYHYSPPRPRPETFNRNRQESAADRIARESDFWRATQVIGGVLLVTMLGMKLARG